MNALTPGDVLIRDKGIWSHSGVLIAPDRVLHTLPGRGIAVTSLVAFASGKPFSVWHPPEGMRPLVLDRALASSRRWQPYDLFVNNCEHLVNRIVYGHSRSEQLHYAVAATALIASMVLFSRADRA